MKLPEKMRALQLQGLNLLKEVLVTVPKPREDELLVRTLSTTICTSDLNDIAHNPFGITLPRILGHEGAGRVAAVGSGVRDWRVGEFVAAHPVIPCGGCSNCQRGLGHLCSRMGHLGLDRDGTFAEYFCIRADRARRVQQDVVGFGSLLEPVAVCLEAVQRGRVAGGETVLVVGDGPFGIIIASLLLGRHSGRVILVGRHEFRLTQVPGIIAVDATRTPNVLNAIMTANDNLGADVGVMAAGTQSALDLCVASVRTRGRVVVFSAVSGQAHIDLLRVHIHELEILGACNDQNLIDEALACLHDPALRLSRLITHRLPFDEWRSAFEIARGRKDEALKVALVFAE